MNAKKEPITGEDALRLATEVHEIFATRGKSVIHVHLAKEKPNRETLSKLLLGPTGNLRAPALRVGKTLVVGFDEGVYREVLGEKDKRSIEQKDAEKRGDGGRRRKIEEDRGR